MAFLVNIAKVQNNFNNKSIQNKSLFQKIHKLAKYRCYKNLKNNEIEKKIHNSTVNFNNNKSQFHKKKLALQCPPLNIISVNLFGKNLDKI